MNNVRNPIVSDKAMWDIWMSIYHLSIVSAADELNLFNTLKNKKLTITELSEAIGLDHRSITALIEPLRGLELLEMYNNTSFGLTPIASTYLLPQSPFYWGAILEAQRGREEHKKILEAIKTDSKQLIFGKKTFTDMWQEGSITPEAAYNFTRKMHATIFAPSLNAIKSGLFKSTKKLLDVGGGSGCFSIAYIQEYPENEATVFELPNVCIETEKYIKESSLLDKISIHPGNFFIKENWPSGFDGILLSQIVHDWPLKDCNHIIENAYNALPCGGKIYIHEMLLHETTASPLTIACFDLLMLINHKSQQFTKSELFDLLTSHGFKNPEVKETFGYYSVVYATK